jgi:uncharacterized protein HemX
MVPMRKIALLTALLVGSVVAGVSLATPQQVSTTPSLGELARQLKAQRDKAASKSVKEYTNDNIPKSGGLMMASSSEPEAGTNGGGGETSAGGSSGRAKSRVHDEKYYHDTMAELQSQKEMHQRELTVLEQKLSQNQMQYYPDPNKTLNQESNPAMYRSDITKKQNEIEQKKKQLEEDDKAITDLQQQCQREGCPPGWLR